MVNRIRKLSVLPLLLAGALSACSPGGAPPNPPGGDSSKQAAQAAPAPPVAEKPVAAQAPAAPPVAAAPLAAQPPAPSPPPANAPKLFVSSTKIDLGVQPKDKTIHRTITVKNIGKSELKIESVVPS